MRVRILVIAGTIFLSLGLVGIALTLAQGAVPGQTQPDAESIREAELSAAAELDAVETIRETTQITAPMIITAPLFVGVDNVAEFTYQIEPDTGNNHPRFNGFEIWGAAYDPDNERVLFVSGTNLYQWSSDGVVEILGSIKSAVGTNVLSMVGLAYGDGVLYGVRNITTPGDPEGLYQIDLDTLVATPLAAFTPDSMFEIGGLDYDGETGKLYGTNDYPEGQGLIEIDASGVITVVAPYPDGQVDLDGLAVGDGRAYLIPDDPGFIYVYDFATLTYTTPISNPWTTEEIFSAGAWIEGPEPIYLPIAAGSPLDEPANR
jgi:hypothetical protein